MSKTKRIREKFVQDSIMRWLEAKDYKISPITHERRGIDVLARNYEGIYYMIECKGETFGENSYLDFCTAIGQLSLGMEKGLRAWRRYCLGLPDTRHYARQFSKFMKLPTNLRRLLKIRFLFVNKNGEIREVKSY